MNGNAVAGKIAQTAEAAHQAKYVDILAFSHLLFGNWLALADIFSIAVAVMALGWLGLEWWRSDSSVMDRPLWAATLCFALVVNPYVPIYDAVLLVVAVALAASARQALAFWLLLLYMIPWVTQSFAEFLHLQLMTLAMAGFGIWVLETASRT